MTQTPSEIKYDRAERTLIVSYEDGTRYEFTSEFLRVNSPSAEVRGHGPGQEVLQIGKEDVSIAQIEAVGNYAIRLVFSDEHDSGIYSWDLFQRLGENKDQLWQDYLKRLAEAGHTRNAD